LKKAFALESFEELLRNAGLKVVSLKNDNLKCYVAVCTTTSLLKSCDI